MMEKWRDVFRRGVAPSLSPAGLEALRGALERNDVALVQGVTTVPPPLHACRNHKLEGACAITYAGWMGEGKDTVEEAEWYFSAVCDNANALLGDPNGHRHLICWWDSTERGEAVRLLLPEVELAISGKVQSQG